jgi:hypothetical protein
MVTGHWGLVNGHWSLTTDDFDLVRLIRNDTQEFERLITHGFVRMRGSSRDEDDIVFPYFEYPVSDLDPSLTSKDVLLVLYRIRVQRHAAAWYHNEPAHGEVGPLFGADQDLAFGVFPSCDILARDLVCVLQRHGVYVGDL